MDYARRNRQISNSYYNLGLEKARIRDLTGAAYCLKKSLHFQKYHTQSRNLLGLVYYEMGEVADALKQWVISLNLQPKDNEADRYIDEIQRKSGRLEVLSMTIKKYNQALLHAKSGSEDLAILQLTRSVEENPNFVKAHLLLATLFILHGDYAKARKSLIRVMKIDQHNQKALAYLAAMKPLTEAERDNRTNYVLSHRKMQDDDVIIPSTYRENSGWQSIINIIVGLILGAAVIYFLIMPANTKAVNDKHNKEMLTYYDKLNQKNMEAEQWKTQAEQLESQYSEVNLQIQTITDDDGYLLKQYQTLAAILEAYRQDDFQQAVLLYTQWDMAMVSDEICQPIAAWISTDMGQKGYQVLESLANKARDRGDYAAALQFYQQSLNIKGDNVQVIYEMAIILKRQDQLEQANDLFGQVIMNFPSSDLAAKAKEERGY